MLNEILVLMLIILDILFIFFASRRSMEWLLGSILVNLLLVGVFGAKLISVFGFVTNIGNIFYASAFLATHFLVEKHGKKIGLQTIWDGVVFILFFNIMSQIAAKLSGLNDSSVVNNAISTLFSFSVRIVIASILGYIFAQFININLYEWLKTHTNGKHLWLRSTGANIVSQLADSMLFFSIAFFDLSGPLLLELILTGWLLKIFTGIVGLPLLYYGNYLDKRKR
ncbi:MAG: queuosine precursor transporter [Candidatus Pacebacteria bacterium]|nr:queuosine precursor transporter [Candidatus Paceibacterota bacterium]